MLAQHRTTGFYRSRSLWSFGLGALLMTVALSLVSSNGFTARHASNTATVQGNQPRISVASTALTNEPCASPNGIIDPGETVTISVALQNTGTANTNQQLVATLLPTGGVTAPSGPQTYGVLVAGGFAFSRSFSFTAAAQEIGSTLTATFQLQDGNVNRGTVSVSFTLGVMTLTTNPGACVASFPSPDQPSPVSCPPVHCQSTARPPFPVGTYLLNCITEAGPRFFFQVIVLDREPPRLTCPANITRPTDANQCAATLNPGTAMASDNCNAGLTVAGARSDNQPLTAAYPLGTTTINWQATDVSGNTAACQQTVTVTANNAPLTCPANISVPATSGAGRVVTYPLPTGSDACSGGAVICNPASGSNFPIGTTTVVCQRSGSAGQPAACTFAVNVIGNAVANVSAASFLGAELASESIVSAFGQRLATTIQAATTLPLPTTLAGTQVLVRDSAGVERHAQLFFVSPTQINYQVPPGTAAGLATVIVTSGDGTVSAESVRIASVAPGLFTVDASGRGLAAATVLRVKSDGSQSFELVASFDATQNKFVAVPIDLGPASEQVFLVLYGSGWRFRSSLAAVTAKIGGADASVSFAGAAANFIGLDQANLLIPRSLIGRGEVEVLLMVDGKAANAARINIK
jgi:uncharacterized protein (TIGR03437 family)